MEEIVTVDINGIDFSQIISKLKQSTLSQTPDRLRVKLELGPLKNHLTYEAIATKMF
jgi:hypothetical protein